MATERLTPITITIDPLPPVMNVAESLERFRTITFGITFMRIGIRRSLAVPGQVDASIWWHATPECYRDQLKPCMERVLQANRGRKLDEAAIEAFVIGLNRDILQNVEPIMPGSIGAHDPEDE